MKDHKWISYAPPCPSYAVNDQDQYVRPPANTWPTGNLYRLPDLIAWLQALIEDSKVVEPYMLVKHTEYEIELTICGWRPLTDAEQKRAAEKRKRDRERRAKVKAEKEAKEKELYERLKAKYGE